MGLQGSVRRGAATESSDIDFVLILDRLDTADLSAYRELVRSMPGRSVTSVSGCSRMAPLLRLSLIHISHHHGRRVSGCHW